MMGTPTFRHDGPRIRWTRYREGAVLLLLGLSAAPGVLGGCAGAEGDESAAPIAEAQAAITTLRLPYGPDPFQFGDLRLPSGPGPHPVVVLIHGGCWFHEFGLDLMTDMAVDLAESGVATWNIEYRRLGNPGGGYPNTFRDVGLAIDHVRTLAPQYNLDLARVLPVGHSAGGHLAVWSTSRDRLPPSSPLYIANPMTFDAVVSLAGVLNLAESLEIDVCADLADDLLGGTPEEVPERYAEASPSELVPLGLDQVLIHGTNDDLVPLLISENYRETARSAGDHHVKLKRIHDADHFDIITPTYERWWKVKKEILKLVR